MDSVRSGKEIRILSWMRFEREGETKVPKYRLAEQHGIYRPMEEALRGKDGGQWFYLNTPRRTGEGLPEFYLQARSGLNLSGLFRLMAGDGTPTRTFYGYPNRKRETDGKKPIPNPFYPAHVDDAFIIQFRELSNAPTGILLVSLGGCRLRAREAAILYYRKEMAEALERLKASPDLTSGHVPGL